MAQKFIKSQKEKKKPKKGAAKRRGLNMVAKNKVVQFSGAY